jgi:hypothetical protein
MLHTFLSFCAERIAAQPLVFTLFFGVLSGYLIGRLWCRGSTPSRLRNPYFWMAILVAFVPSAALLQHAFVLDTLAASGVDLSGLAHPELVPLLLGNLVGLGFANETQKYLKLVAKLEAFEKQPRLQQVSEPE